MSPFHRKAWTTLWDITAPFFRSDRRWRAAGGLALLIGLVLSVSWLDWFNSYVCKDFMTALAERRAGRFTQFAFAYVGVFGAITAFAVMLRFTEERLGLFWRTWLTGHLINRYLANQTYYRLTGRPDIDNPDQRITEDVKSFTATTLSFLLILLKACVSLLLFARVLWEITPLLFLAAVAYGAAGTVSTLVLGRRLMGLNYEQLEARSRPAL